ncbi:winged helix-turn-helix transcriptional regulator [Candidatus Woesearchaeota archaeon]|nr:winged helix-turn-helix transcriptional regulator [Candidatus Woesearchaeota archaeon]
MKNLLWYLIAGTKGGETRGKIIELLWKKPTNAHMIAKTLNLDYKTIRHHLEVLEKNNVIVAVNKGKYGAVYFLSELMESNKQLFGEIWEQFWKK